MTHQTRERAPSEGPSKQLAIRLPCDLVDWLEACSAEEGRTLSAVIRHRLREAMQQVAA